MLTKKTFSIKEKVGSYSIRITADDYYKLYINGQYVAQGVAQGYHFCYYWNEIDITAFLREGATTCFEAWGKDQKWNTSLCHPWASGPISVLAEDILPNMPHVGKIVYKQK